MQPQKHLSSLLPFDNWQLKKKSNAFHPIEDGKQGEVGRKKYKTWHTALPVMHHVNKHRTAWRCNRLLILTDADLPPIQRRAFTNFVCIYLCSLPIGVELCHFFVRVQKNWSEQTKKNWEWKVKPIIMQYGKFPIDEKVARLKKMDWIKLNWAKASISSGF